MNVRLSPPAPNPLRWFWIALAVVLVCAAGYAFLRSPLGDYWLRRFATKVTVGERPLNLLVIANNARNLRANQPLGLGSAAGQADVLLVLHVDPMQRGIWAIPIPRDALVAQPHWHNIVPKIKTLFFLGNQESPPRGPQLTLTSVSALTGLPIDGYVAMNFAGFRDAVDFVGGLDVNVRQRLYDPQNSHADFRPGLQHMNGAQVLAYVRVRQNEASSTYRVNDFQRMDAEIEVVSLLRAKLLDPKTVAVTLPRFVQRIGPDVATNLPQDRLVRLGLAMVSVPITKVPISTIADSMLLSSAPIDGVNAEGRIVEAYYDVLDPNDVCRRLRRFGARRCSTGLPAALPARDVTVVVSGTHQLVERLRAKGYTVRVAGRATGQQRVVYPAGAESNAWEAARLMGSGSVTVEPGSKANLIVSE